MYLPLRTSIYLFPTQARVAFGQPLSKNASVLQTLGKMRVRLDGAKLATLDAARLLDAEGNKSAKGAIAACKGEFILILVRAIALTSFFFVLSRGSGCRHRGDRRGDSDPRCVGRVRRHPAGEDVRGCADAAVGGRAGRGSPGDHSQVGSAAVAFVGKLYKLFFGHLVIDNGSSIDCWHFIRGALRTTWRISPTPGTCYPPRTAGSPSVCYRRRYGTCTSPKGTRSRVSTGERAGDH